MSLIEEEMDKFFPSIQYGVRKPGGSESAAQLTLAELEVSRSKYPDTIALKVDVKNAFNTINRSKVWSALLDNSRTAPILRAFYWQYAEPSSLLIYERGQLAEGGELISSNGVRQGDPFSAFAFAFCMQNLYERALEAAAPVPSERACNGISIQDDFTIIGPAEQVMRCYDYIKVHALDEYDLQLVPSKCQVYIPPSTPQEVANTIHPLCRERQLTYKNEMESLGVMFGNDECITNFCKETVEESRFLFDCLRHPSMPKQIGAMLLRECALPKLGYLTRTVHPDRLMEPAKSFDSMVLSTYLEIVDFNEHTLTSMEPHLHDMDSTLAIDPGDGSPLTITKRDSLVTKQQLLTRMSLPISLGGLGLRPVERTMYPAYFSSLMQILPYFARMHPEMLSIEEFKKTKLYSRLNECREKVLSQGAGDPIPAGPWSNQGKGHQPTLTEVLNHDAPRVVNTMGVTTTTPLSAAPRSAPRSCPPSIFPSPSPMLIKSFDDQWKLACEEESSNTFSAVKLQSDITSSIEGHVWTRLYHACNKYQQSIMISLSLNNSTSAWLTTSPLNGEPAYTINNGEYILAVRHRLGILPYDNLRNQQCLTCAGARNKETPELLIDPDHVHSCLLQRSRSVRVRHDRLKMVLAYLARSCGYLVDIEAEFPATMDGTSTGLRGDLLLWHGSTCELVDVTVVRPSQLTLLVHGSESSGSHKQPLVAASRAEKYKHQTYDMECARRGWKFVPFVVETYGALGQEAASLLGRISAHHPSMNQSEFLSYANSCLSICLQRGNACVSERGTAEMLRSGYRLGPRTRDMSGQYEVTVEEDVLYGDTSHKDRGLQERVVHPAPTRITIPNDENLYLFAGA
jgi:hypothetical protein